MGYNPWTCDCDIAWLVKVLQCSLYFIARHATCSEPDNLLNIKLQSLDAGNLTCKMNTRNSTNISEQVIPYKAIIISLVELAIGLFKVVMIGSRLCLE